MPHLTTFRVRQYECDAYGHLNNVNYLRYLGEAGLEASAAAGYDLTRYAAMGRRWQTRRLDIEYLRPARYGDSVEVRVSAPAFWADGHAVRGVTADESVPRTPSSWGEIGSPQSWGAVFVAGIMRRAYEFRLVGSGNLVAQAQDETACVDATTGQPAEIPDELIRAAGSGVQADPLPPIEALPRLPDPPPGVFAMPQRVTWPDLDMTRQVSDATLLGYVETCGFGVIAAHGWPAARMAAEGFAIILRRHQIEHFAAATLDDELEVATWVSDVKRATATRHYTIRRARDGTLLTRVDTLGVWVDLATGRPIRIPPAFLADFAPNLVG